MTNKQMALYRKYRPSGFDGLVGQDHIKTTLENAIKNEQVSHAYVFTGPRGTGKTSTAKLFAKALNCENPNGVNPCGQCHSCTNDASDIIEIDAASNNSVDDIRQLRENIMLAPMYGKYKIYILDEAHMLTTQAFNAFLTTLEEPPAHARFILATTEVHKLPATILSRCQRFDFRRISNLDIVSRLSYILDAEGRTAESQALELIAQVSAGGMRDSISLLDQSLSRQANTSDTVKLDDVLSLTGSVDVRLIGKLISLISNKQIEESLTHFNQCFENGKEPKFFVEEMMIYLRDILVFKKLGASATLKKGSTDANFQSIATAVDVDSVYVYLDELQRTLSEMKFHHDLQLLLEMTIIRMINNERASLQNQIDELRKMISTGVTIIEPTKQCVEQTVETLGASNESLMVNNTVSKGNNITIPENEQTIEIQEFKLPSEEQVAHSMAKTVPSSGREISIPEFSLENMNAAASQQAECDGFVFELPVFNNGELKVPEQPNAVDNAAPIEVNDPINFIEQAVEQHAQGIDWASSMPSEQATTSVEQTVATVAPTEETNQSIVMPFVINAEESKEEVTVPEFSFEMPGNENSIPAFSTDQSSNNGTVFPQIEPQQSSDPSITPASSEASNLPANSNIILSDEEKNVLNLLNTANKKHKADLEAVSESISFELGNVNITSKRIFTNFAIKAVNEDHLVLVHDEKVQVKLINKLAHVKNIEETFENIYKPMKYVAITTEQWKAITAVFQANN
ncbi:MAG: DNA polymerase III subunit gamma/tau [Kurthia sp.]|nr:DNA polymerase III subunit gamma/tau [Candidatus Kurthia equi]